jgi:PadR family transcriptional regulator PadR
MKATKALHVVSFPLTSEGNACDAPLILREERMPKTDLLQGTLDLLILKILTLGPNHGWDISNRIRQLSREGLQVSQGSLYPALHRLELHGDVESEMTASENNRRARVYKLTPAGRRRLETEKAAWEHFALSMKRIIQAES